MHRRVGVPPDGTMCLKGTTLVVVDELKFQLKSWRPHVNVQETWKLKAGCQSCMAQLLVLLTKHEVKIVYDKGMPAETMKKLKIGLFAGAGVIVGVCAIPLGLPLLGFRSAGVAAGSIAASIQSVVYGGFTRGLFSLAQSAGAAGIGAATTAIMGAVGGAAGAGAAAVMKSSDSGSSNRLQCTCGS